MAGNLTINHTESLNYFIREVEDLLEVTPNPVFRVKYLNLLSAMTDLKHLHDTNTVEAKQ